MASSSPPPPPHKARPRKLFEVLEEQQEPFILLERTVLQSRAAFLSWRPKRKRGGSWRCLPTKLRCWGVIERALNWWNSSSRAPQHGRIWSASDCFAEATSTSGRVGGGFHRLSCSGDDGVVVDVDAELNGNKGTEWKEYELSPVSVLEVHSDVDSSVHNPLEKERRSSYILDSATTEAGTVRLAPLFKETSEREKRCVWENQWGDLSLVTNLISLDFDGSRKKWSKFQDQKREVATDIEGFILEELGEECVLDML